MAYLGVGHWAMSPFWGNFFWVTKFAPIWPPPSEILDTPLTEPKEPKVECDLFFCIDNTGTINVSINVRVYYT